jgi:hypothetical protein
VGVCGVYVGVCGVYVGVCVCVCECPSPNHSEHVQRGSLWVNISGAQAIPPIWNISTPCYHVFVCEREFLHVCVSE